MRDRILAALLALAALLIAAGVATWSTGAALIVAGVLLAVWSLVVIVIGDAMTPSPSAPPVPVDGDSK